MRRAFVGFSSPIGYSYKQLANPTRNDASSSPNPILYGASGLLVLFDEIWFACESLCPQAMRGLPYVKYLDRDGPGMNLKAQGFDEVREDAYEISKGFPQPGLDAVFGTNYGDGMSRYLGARLNVDNHTHGLNFFDTGFGGNMTPDRLAADLWLITRFKNLDLTPVLNPLTAQLALQLPGREPALGIEALGRMALAERVVTVDTMYDLVGLKGPYHPVLEELRNDPLVGAFRKWMDGQTTGFDNHSVEMVSGEVNATIRSFMREKVRALVKGQPLRKVAFDLVADSVLELVPGASLMVKFAKMVGANSEVSDLRWQAFVALSRDTIDARVRAGARQRRAQP